MKQTAKRNARLKSGKHWIKTYSGKRIVKGYSKKYGVNMLCAVKELRLLGLEISEEYEKQLWQGLKALKQQKLASKKKRVDEFNALLAYDSDDYIAMIMGYTSGGAAYGITHEEMEILERQNQENIDTITTQNVD